MKSTALCIPGVMTAVVAPKEMPPMSESRRLGLAQTAGVLNPPFEGATTMCKWLLCVLAKQSPKGGRHLRRLRSNREMMRYKFLPNPVSLTDVLCWHDINST